MKASASKGFVIGFGAAAIGLFALVASIAGIAPAAAEDAAVVRLAIKDHRFQPAEARAPAGKPITIEIRNLDPTPAEFESKTMRVEKVVAGGGAITVQIRPLPAGRYRFFDDYHEDTTEGFLVVQ
ncbi:cupredoxin domain-containing protein [Methylocapsa acidiphila]|uniref:cupredoxin domain-containing protein n=1 Tax=Methylocapsa acidiphila TaxID=133552 RepID=UPI0004172DD1|nr:cupredoxin domain-containing protein [Methylocapsa acidiphila]